MAAPSAPNNGTPFKFRRRDWDTGFPEPFNSDRNTTLPYPGADLSPNACISMTDLLRTNSFNSIASSTRSSRRTRLHKHKRTVSYGIISAQQSVLSGIDTGGGGQNKDEPATPVLSASSAAAETPLSATFTSPRTSKEDDDSSLKHDEDTPPSSPEMGSAHSVKKTSRRSWFRRG